MKVDLIFTIKLFMKHFLNPEHNPVESKTSERFDLIRDWAATRGNMIK